MDPWPLIRDRREASRLSIRSEFGPIDALALSCPTRYHLAPRKAAASSGQPNISLRAESSSSLKSG